MSLLEGATAQHGTSRHGTEAALAIERWHRWSCMGRVPRNSMVHVIHPHIGNMAVNWAVICGETMDHDCEASSTCSTVVPDLPLEIEGSVRFQSTLWLVRFLFRFILFCSQFVRSWRISMRDLLPAPVFFSNRNIFVSKSTSYGRVAILQRMQCNGRGIGKRLATSICLLWFGYSWIFVYCRSIRAFRGTL